MAWVEIVVESREKLDRDIRDGVYTELVESESPVRILHGNSTWYFSGGVSTYQLRKLCSELSRTPK